MGEGDLGMMKTGFSGSKSASNLIGLAACLIDSVLTCSFGNVWLLTTAGFSITGGGGGGDSGTGILGIDSFSGSDRARSFLLRLDRSL